MAEEFLLEIGVEELPASFVEKALAALPSLATTMLAEARIAHGAVRTYGTPRRLVLAVSAMEERQRDVSEDVLGPPKSIGIGADGKPSPAAVGFAKKLGFGPEAIRVVETPKGEYVAVRREQTGAETATVLRDLITKLCAAIPFQKSMRWGKGDIAFGRPVHWIVALLGERVVPTEFAGVASGRSTRGHRFLAPAPVSIPHASRYVDALRAAHVVVDPGERLASVRSLLVAEATKLSGVLVDDTFLEGECTGLVEKPFVVPGGFENEFLDLPEDVIVSVMRGHQRYFAVRDAKTGKLLPSYLNVVNTANDPATIRRGNDSVLRARLKDARFFVDEDRKVKLADRAKKLEGVVFQNKLGTVAAKVNRIAHVAQTLAPAPDASSVHLAAQLAKADLVSLIVGEFPELQGSMGRYYALREGVDARVADAIRDHYAPRGASDDVPKDAIAVALAVADRIDTLVGCFGIGLVPSGSADPFALRRAALGIVRIALENDVSMPLDVLIRTAYEQHDAQVLAPLAEVMPKLKDFFTARLKAFYSESFPADVVEACLASWECRGSIRDLDARIRALDAFRREEAFTSLAVAFKRANNITKEWARDDVAFVVATCEPGADRDLAEAWRGLVEKVDTNVVAKDYVGALKHVANLRAPIDTFFEKVMVNTDDVPLRENRLRLLTSIVAKINSVAHFHLLTAQG